MKVVLIGLTAEFGRLAQPLALELERREHTVVSHLAYADAPSLQRNLEGADLLLLGSSSSSTTSFPQIEFFAIGTLIAKGIPLALFAGEGEGLEEYLPFQSHVDLVLLGTGCEVAIERWGDETNMIFLPMQDPAATAADVLIDFLNQPRAEDDY